MNVHLRARVRWGRASVASGTLAVLGVLGVLLTGCGGNGPAPAAVPSLSQGSNGTQATDSAHATKLHAAAACIRQHGIPGYADPVLTAGGAVYSDLRPIQNASDATLAAVQAACRTLMAEAWPQPGERAARAAATGGGGGPRRGVRAPARPARHAGSPRRVRPTRRATDSASPGTRSPRAARRATASRRPFTCARARTPRRSRPPPCRAWAVMAEGPGGGRARYPAARYLAARYLAARDPAARYLAAYSLAAGRAGRGGCPGHCGGCGRNHDGAGLPAGPGRARHGRHRGGDGPGGTCRSR